MREPGVLELWGGVDEDDGDYVLFAEMTTDSAAASDVETIRQVLRGVGLTQLVGD